MSQKPEYYTVLGIEKTATLEEIKKAYQKQVMRNHPDRKPPEEKAAAQLKFQEIQEAYDVLSDANKRTTYDNYGHDGLARMASGQGGTGRSFSDLAGEGPKRTTNPDEAMAFFDRGGDLPDIPVATVPVDRAAAAEARKRAQEARRSGARPSVADVLGSLSVNVPPADPIGRPSKPAPAPTPAPAPVAQKGRGTDFEGAARDVRAASEKIGDLGRNGSVEVPVETLERFRDNVREMLATLDAAIARANKPGGPRP